MEFIPFQKIARYSREIVITEKIDGTNGLVEIRELPDDQEMPTHTPIVAVVGKMLIYAGSRTTWITPEKDNYGFAAWVKANAEELVKLGVGRHFGEWWGQGIQRKYDLPEKRWSLFNVSKWYDASVRPACCHVVPILGEGLFHSSLIDGAMSNLVAGGSAGAPGFKSAEGIIVYHVQGNIYFKKTILKDEEWKGKQ